MGSLGILLLQGHSSPSVQSSVGDRAWYDPGCQVASDGSWAGAGPEKRKKEHGGSVDAVGPGTCVSPHLPSGQGLLQPSLRAPAAAECHLRAPSSHYSEKGGGFIFPVSLNVIAFTGFGNQFYGLRYLSTEIWEALEEK